MLILDESNDNNNMNMANNKLLTENPNIGDEITEI